MSLTAAFLSLMLFTFPFGPALQNFGMLLAFMIALVFLIKRKINPSLPPQGAMRWAAISILGMLVLNVISTLINPDNHDQESLHYFLGYLPIVVLPWLAGSLPTLETAQRQKIENIFAIVVLVWGVLSLTQVYWPWRWIGSMPVLGGTPRAQGFYSHPLTLAYAALLLWPYAILRLFHSPRAWQGWLLTVGTLLMLIYSMSRTAQALAALLVLGNIFWLFSGRRRWQALAVCLALGLGLALTKNPVSIRFTQLIQGESNDHFSDYPDDRLAFWHAHLLMIQERPLIGHGVHLDLDYRHPFYAKLGMADFKKQYPAHNQFLQIATEGGLIALGLFVAWLGFSFQALREQALPPLLRSVLKQLLWVFILGGLTQNAFFDSDIRTGLVIAWVCTALAWPRPAPARTI
jgi:O-antigen ligase